MPTPTKGARLGGSPAHQRHILANLATALFEHGKITTTHAKARRLRPYAERLITKAKRGDLHNRRQVMSTITDKSVVHVLFTEIGPRFATRPGGYTRITKIGPRHGDNAPMAVIELVEPLAEGVVAEADAATRRSARGNVSEAPAATASPAPAEPADGEVGDDELGSDVDDELTPELSTDPVQDEVATDEAAEADAEATQETAADEARAAADRAERAADEAEEAAAQADAAADDAEGTPRA